MDKLQVAMALETISNNYEYKIFSNLSNDVIAVKQKRAVYPIWFTFKFNSNGCELAGIFLKIRNIVYSLDHNYHPQMIAINTDDVNKFIEFITKNIHIQYYQFKAGMRKHLHSIKVLTRGESGIMDFMLLPYNHKDKTFVCTHQINNGSCSVELYIEDVGTNAFKRIRGIKVKRPELNLEFYESSYKDDKYYYFSLFKTYIIKKLYEEVL